MLKFEAGGRLWEGAVRRTNAYKDSLLRKSNRKRSLSFTERGALLKTEDKNGRSFSVRLTKSDKQELQQSKGPFVDALDAAVR